MFLMIFTGGRYKTKTKLKVAREPEEPICLQAAYSKYNITRV